MNNVELLQQLSTEEIQNLLQLAHNINDGSKTFELPPIIKESLDNSTTREQQKENSKFIKRLRVYDGENWTRPGATNKELINELKKAHVDANQLVQQIYKDAEKIRHTARAATELYEDIDTILELDDLQTIQQELSNLQQKCGVLSIYGFSTSKQLDQDAKKITTTAIRLPQSMRYIAEIDEEDKDMAFSSEDMERLHTERFQERLLQQGAYRRSNGNHAGRGRGGKQYYNQRPQQHQQKSFFGKPRHQQQQQSQPQYKSANQTQQPNQEQQN
jgi:hypothetical protein